MPGETGGIAGTVVTLGVEAKIRSVTTEVLRAPTQTRIACHVRGGGRSRGGDRTDGTRASQYQHQRRYAATPPRYEVVPASRRGYVWTPGYWNWGKHGYVWIAGSWRRARPGYLYHHPRWVRSGNRWDYRPAYWGRDPHLKRHDNGRHRGHHKHRGDHGH